MGITTNKWANSGQFRYNKNANHLENKRLAFQAVPRAAIENIKTA